MQLARRRLNEQNEAQGLLSLEMGIGINTGTCIVGNMGAVQRIKYGVVGSAVNLASRLESFTAGGQVLISESTYQAVAPHFEVAGPLEAYAKGVEGALRLWEVRGVASKEKDKSLPPTVPDLIRLAAPLPVLVRLITGKRVSPEPYKGGLLQLSSAGAELETELPLEIFAALQMEIPGLAEPGLLIDAKVVGVAESRDSYIIKFSRLPGAAAAAVSRILAENPK